MAEVPGWIGSVWYPDTDYVMVAYVRKDECNTRSLRVMVTTIITQELNYKMHDRVLMEDLAIQICDNN